MNNAPHGSARSERGDSNTSESSSSAPTLTYAKLSAFFFHLDTNSRNERDEEADAIWSRLKSLGTALDSDDLHTLIRRERKKVPDRIEVLRRQETPPGRFRPVFATTPRRFSVPSLERKGRLYAFLQHDTLALDLTLETDLTVTLDLSGLHPESLRPAAMQPSLGQSFLLIGHVTRPSSRTGAVDYRALAKTCARQLVGYSDEDEAEPPPAGQLHGSPFFEFEVPTTGRVGPRHLIVWLMTHDHSIRRENDGDYYFPLLRLLAARAKIHRAHLTARALYHSALETQTKVERRATELGHLPKAEPERLDALETYLTDLPPASVKQTQHLQGIRKQDHMLQSNRTNVRWSVDELKHTAESGDDLDCLAAIADQEADVFARQIDSYAHHLALGEALTERVLTSIQTQTEVLARRQQHRTEDGQRRFTAIVGFLGVALAISTVTATVGEDIVRTYVVHTWDPGEAQLLLETIVHILLGVIPSFGLTVGVHGLLSILRTRRTHKRNRLSSAATPQAPTRATEAKSD